MARKLETTVQRAGLLAWLSRRRLKVQGAVEAPPSERHPPPVRNLRSSDFTPKSTWTRFWDRVNKLVPENEDEKLARELAYFRDEIARLPDDARAQYDRKLAVAKQAEMQARMEDTIRAWLVGITFLVHLIVVPLAFQNAPLIELIVVGTIIVNSVAWWLATRTDWDTSSRVVTLLKFVVLPSVLLMFGLFGGYAFRQGAGVS